LQYVSAMSIYAIVLFVAAEVFSKSSKFATYFFVGVLLSFPLWMHTIDGWFRWVKYLSVFIPIIILGCTRISVIEEKKGLFWNKLKNPKFLWFFYAMIFLNILEATIKDVTLGNYFNAGAGIILCASLPLASKYWKIDKERNGEILAYTTIAWAFLYTTWNACFVYSESPIYFASSLTILLVAFFYPVIKKRPDLYIQARTYTLAIHLLLRATFDVFPSTMNASSWFRADVLMWWGIINFAIATPYLIWYAYGLMKRRTEENFNLKKATV